MSTVQQNSGLLDTRRTCLTAEAFLTKIGDKPPQEIEKSSQDTRAWFITEKGVTYFTKWVEDGRYQDRLAKDAEICSRNLHPAIVPLLNIVETADGMLLVFPKIPGLSLEGIEARQRFFALPVPEKIRSLTACFEALSAIVESGWILVDFYDGNVIYDFETGATTLFDFELFERGNGFTLQKDRNYGSRRLMAPEEFVRGALIDQRSNVFTLGRYAIDALSGRIDAEWRQEFQGNNALAEVLDRATQWDPEARYQTVSAFLEAFKQTTCDAFDRS
jgi:serine/threonine-protein kinase